MKLGKEFNSDLKQRQKKSTTDGPMGPIADFDIQVPIFRNRLRMESHSAQDLIYHHSIKERNKVTKHNWVHKHASSLP